MRTCPVNFAPSRVLGTNSMYLIFPAGSSPLTRGGPAGDRLFRTFDGLIPAYAGRTPMWRCGCGLKEAHPRLRGADLDVDAEHGGGLGSSPLTRGGPLALRRCKAHAGLIPAYAGRTHDVGSFLWRWGAHPRLRGADVLLGRCSSLWWGSSPLTRGGQNERIFGTSCVGLIPAYAGRTPARSGLAVPIPAHPRLRGADASASGISCGM